MGQALSTIRTQPTLPNCVKSLRPSYTGLYLQTDAGPEDNLRRSLYDPRTPLRPRAQGASARTAWGMSVQGNLTYKKTHPPRTLP